MIVYKKIAKTLCTTLLMCFLLSSMAIPVFAETGETVTKSNGYAGATTDNGTLEFKPPDRTTNFADKNINEVGGTMMNSGRMISAGISGFLAIISVGIFGWHAFALATFETFKPGQRKTYVKNIIFAFIGFVLLGSVSLYVGLFYNLFR